VISGEIGSALCESARFVDLLLLPLNHPPDDKPISRLSSGLASIIRSCPIPVLTVPGPQKGLESILLAFDGSLQAIEAMFISAYFGTQFSSKLHVLTSRDGFPNAEHALNHAKTYLSQFPLSAKYTLSQAAVPEAIKEIQNQEALDLILMGGYGGSILRDLVVGSVVDRVLREIRLPVLICR
jgi:nucleotide-binding universal stress UspA family protein